jgi:hypothetical protein
LRGNMSLLFSALGRLSYPVFPVTGCLANGTAQSEQANVISGTQTSSGALATMVISGELQVGIGSSQGWGPVGMHFKITDVDEMMLRTLDDQPAVRTGPPLSIGS